MKVLMLNTPQSTRLGGGDVAQMRKTAEAMKEMGVDMSGHHSKTLDDLPGLSADYVVTVCDDAKENCPYAPGQVETIHHSFRDPSHAGETPEENLAAFIRTRDEIESWLVERFSPV